MDMDDKTTDTINEPDDVAKIIVIDHIKIIEIDSDDSETVLLDKRG